MSRKNPPPPKFSDIFPKRLGIFIPNFTRLLHVPIYARLQMFIQLSATLTKLCHIKRHHHNMLVQLGLPSFDTLIFNSRVSLSRQCQILRMLLLGIFAVFIPCKFLYSVF